MQYSPIKLLRALGMAVGHVLLFGAVVSALAGSDSKAGLGYPQPEANGHRQVVQLALQTGYQQPPNPGYRAVQAAQASAHDDPSYCIRTFGRLTLRPGENLVLRDIIKRMLRDATLLSFDGITGEGRNLAYNFSFTDKELKERRTTKDGATLNVTGSLDEERVSYRIVMMEPTDVSVTALFGPTACFPTDKKESTTAHQ